MFFEHVEASCISDESRPWMPLGLAPASRSNSSRPIRSGARSIAL